MADLAILSVKHPHKTELVDFGLGSKQSKPGSIKTEFDGLKVTSAKVKLEEDWLGNVIRFMPSSDAEDTLMDLKCEIFKSETDVFENDIGKMEDAPPESGEKADCVQDCDNNHKRSKKACKAREKARKIFECDQCGLCFGRKDQFIVHTYFHTGEKPHSCSVCQKSFSRADSMAVHMRIHTGQRPYKCDQCDKTFRTSGHRREHQFIHAGIKPYACSYCDQSFAHANDLVKHQRMHTGERPYPCSKCEMTFRRLQTLKKHVFRKHESEASLTCSNCATVFKSKGHLEKHIRSHCKKKQC